MSEHKIKVAITSGDINGIGLETIIKVLADPRMADMCTPIIYAHPEVIRIHKSLSIPL
jgi:4-hydroxythreonine-4-phosphate dehydrogenase